MLSQNAVTCPAPLLSRQGNMQQYLTLVNHVMLKAFPSSKVRVCTFKYKHTRPYPLLVPVATESPQKRYHADGIAPEMSINETGTDQTHTQPHLIKLLLPKVLFLCVAIAFLVVGTIGLILKPYHSSRSEYYSNRYCAHANYTPNHELAC